MDDVTLLQGDCLEVMAGLPDGSVDAIVTDPPYGQSNESYDVGVDPRIWSECYRLAGTPAMLLCFTGNPTYHRLASAIERAGWHVRQMWAWVYRDGLMTSAWPSEGFDRLAPALTPICFATKGKVLLPLEREGSETWTRPRRKIASFSARSSGDGALHATGRWPRTIVAEDGIADFQYFVLSPTSPSLREEQVGHPNQKPLALMRWLVTKTPHGATVLDPFLGSGTTAVACLLEGRRCIGIERDPAYFALAQQRVADAIPPLLREA